MPHNLTIWQNKSVKYIISFKSIDEMFPQSQADSCKISTNMQEQ